MMVTIYQRLLQLYPTEHRQQFGEEMLDVFRDSSTEIQNKTLIARTAFCVREFNGVLRGAAVERLRILIQTDIRNWLFCRRFTMRDGFRFPKTTAVLMLLILAGVVLAIKRGEDIAASLPHVNPQIAPVHSMPSALLPPIVLFLLFFYAAGFIGWLILYALRRSGMHRLDQLSAQPK